MRHALLLAAIAWIAVPASACSASQPSAPAEQRAEHDGRLMPPEKVADHVWVMRQPDRLWAAVIGNVTIIEQSDGVVLVDSGGSIPDGRDIVRAVAGLTPKPIKAVAITHWHNDHPLGVPGILEAFPNARIISTAITADLVKTETNVSIGKPDPVSDAQRAKRAEETIKALEAEAAKAEGQPGLQAQYALETKWIAQRVKRQMGNYVVAPTTLVTDRLVIPDKAAPVELHFLGTANTRGDLIAWLPRQRVAVTGDVVVLPTPYGFTISTKPWLASLAKLEQLPFAVLVPGHGRVQRDRSYLDTLKWSMSDIAAKASAAAADPAMTTEKAVAAFDNRPHEARFGATDAWAKKWLNDYWLAGMFQTAFDEARGTPAPGK